MTPTRDRIWQAALELFATHGYDGVSVKAIAQAVGIKDASLYNHYQSKKAIFDTILEKASEQIKEASRKFSFIPDGEAWQRYEQLSKDELIQISLDLFNFYLNDPFVSKFRKLLIREKYSNNQVSALYEDIFIDQVLAYQTHVFDAFIQHNHFIEANPATIALHFYAPLFLLLHRYDTSEGFPDQAESLIRDHIHQFVENYKRGRD